MNKIVIDDSVNIVNLEPIYEYCYVQHKKYFIKVRTRT